MLIKVMDENLSTTIFILSFLFSYDARAGDGDSGRRWSDEVGGFGPRAYFQTRGVMMAHLNVDDIRRNEAGLYRCRVDFKTAPTRNKLLNLTVVGKRSHFLAF